MRAVITKLLQLINDLLLLIALMFATFMIVLFVHIISTHKEVIKNINETMIQDKIIEKEGVC